MNLEELVTSSGMGPDMRLHFMKVAARPPSHWVSNARELLERSRQSSGMGQWRFASTANDAYADALVSFLLWLKS